MRKFTTLLLLTVLAIFVAACNSTETPAVTPEPAEEATAVSQETAAEEEPAAKPEIGEAIVDSVTVAQQGDEYVATVEGNLPDGCTQIDESSQVVVGNVIQITLTTIRPADMMCTAALVPYTEEIAIDTDGLADGEYTVEVNGIAAAEAITIGQTEPAEVTGTIVYRERIALPDDAVVSVQLQDTSLADAPATVLGEDTYVTEGAQVPLPFAVSYNPADIQDNHQYSLSVRITDAVDNLLFINDTVVPVITNDYPTSDIEVQVISVAAPEAGAGEGMAEDSIFNKTWQWVGFSDPAVGPQEIEQPQRYELIINRDGTANIKADCNNVQATYLMDDHTITFVLGPTTLVACPTDSLADDYLTNLEAAAIWFTQEGELYFDLIYDSGTMQFSEATSDDFAEMLIGPVWEWTDYRLANVTTAVPNAENYLIQFLPDGVATIKADCNNILAEYTLEEDVLTLLLGPTTMVFCGEESLDTQYVASLSDVGIVSFDDEGFLRLALNSEDGELFFHPGGEQVTGNVTYLQRIALPEDAVLQVTLQDVSLADAPSIVIGAQIYKTDGAQVPLPYVVSYNPEIIQDGHTYTVAARITDAEGNLLYINDTSIPVINNSETTDIEIMVVPAN